eukprot:1153303-Pelagomonas_calceolata.AAC.7
MSLTFVSEATHDRYPTNAALMGIATTNSSLPQCWTKGRGIVKQSNHQGSVLCLFAAACKLQNVSKMDALKCKGNGMSMHDQPLTTVPLNVCDDN